MNVIIGNPEGLSIHCYVLNEVDSDKIVAVIECTSTDENITEKVIKAIEEDYPDSEVELIDDINFEDYPNITFSAFGNDDGENFGRDYELISTAKY